MRKNFSLILFLFLFTYSFSQENDSKRMKYGINAGVNLFDLKQEEFFDRFYNHRINYTIGLSAEYQFNNKFSLLMNINYDKKSVGTDSFVLIDEFANPTEFTIKNTIKFNFINLPLYTRYYLGNKKRFYIDGGIFYNIILNSDDVAEVNETGEEITVSQLGGSIETNDYGALIGFGFQFKLLNNRFQLQIRNEFGFANIASADSNMLNDFQKVKTNTFRIILNWELPI